ncbi:PREDICTED: F-box only protein 21-like [Dinoponera quadriceps]|uniref:F-box only protein 21-like n=1 Tax=Dinoponera quadriceps TaxID=609295 RepID=A0A6P3Y5B6_DINQU|nr:PREDICTED: F-box only protein 21-like [Dinoponera quadriceps]
MANVTRLPDDVICLILENENISIKDVANFSLTCKLFYTTINKNNALWRCKFFQRWPALKTVCNQHWCDGHRRIKKEIKERLKCRQKLLNYFSRLYDRSYYKGDLSFKDMLNFKRVFCMEDGDTYPLEYYYLEDEVNEILRGNEWDRHTNLRHKYYAQKVSMYLKECQLRKKWQRFTSQPAAQQISEWTATFMAEWCKPQEHVSYSYIVASLDNIAQQALKVLQEKYPNHSIFLVSTEQLFYWKTNMNNDNQWNKTETKQILEAICRVMFHNLGFRVFNDSERTSSSYKNFIDNVLEDKCGDVLMLTIIFESVARRLGVPCDYFTFSSYFSLVWRDRCDTTKAESESYYYIDIFSNGTILSRAGCPRSYSDTSYYITCPVKNCMVPKPTPAQLIARLLNYVHMAGEVNDRKKAERNRLIQELRHMVNPEDLEGVSWLIGIYSTCRMDLSDIEMSLKKVQDTETNPLETRSGAKMVLDKLSLARRTIPPYVIVPKKRSKYVNYAVGMIVEFDDYTSEPTCTGVITGWGRDGAIFCDEEDSNKQTTILYYEVFFSGNKNFSLPQVCIKPAKKPTWIDHREIGRYFSHFEGTHYMPNQKLLEEYPDDLEVLREYCKRYHKRS